VPLVGARPPKEEHVNTHRIKRFAIPREGELRAVSAAGLSIVVTVVDGRLYAFDELCTHALCSLLEGEVEGKTVVCPCHQGQFDLTTGDVLAGPPPSPLGTYGVRMVGRALELDLP
jgi:nitrite reductase/ring-hydroxylating ferredoxin subunit